MSRIHHLAAAALAGALAFSAQAALIVVDMSGASAVDNSNVYGGGSGSSDWTGQTVTLVNPLAVSLTAGDYTLSAAGTQGLYRAFQAQTDFLYPQAFTNNFVVAVASATQAGQYDVLQNDHISGDPNNYYDYDWGSEQEAYDAFQGLSWGLHLAQATTLYFTVASSFPYDQPDNASGTSIVINAEDTPTPGGTLPESPMWALLVAALAAGGAARRKA